MGGHAGPREMAGDAPARSAGGCRMPNALELLDVGSDRLEEVLRRAEQSLDEKDAELIRAVFESYTYVTELVDDRTPRSAGSASCSSGLERRRLRPWSGRRPGRPRSRRRLTPRPGPSWRPKRGPTTFRKRRRPRRVTAATAPRPTKVHCGSTWRTHRCER